MLVACVVALVHGLAIPGSATERTGGGRAPAEWDERVVELVEFVEAERGLEFEHPVRVRFLGDDAFVRKLQGGSDELTEREQREADRFVQALHALGLIEKPFDTTEASDALITVGVVGAYDPETGEMYVRGRNARKVETRVVLVHELTHALQDQYFDLDGLYRRAKTSSAGFVREVLIEGDASRVEDAYVATLSDAEQEQWEFYEFFGPVADLGPEELRALQRLKLPPPVYISLVTVAYSVGPPFVQLVAGRSPTALDALFRDPPATDDVVLDPAATKDVPAFDDPRRGNGDHFGAYVLYLLLATSVDEPTALAAVTGYRDDQITGSRDDGRNCVRWNIVADDAAETSELGDALNEWIKTLPRSMATVDVEESGIHVDSCSTRGASEPRGGRVLRAEETLEQRLRETLGIMEQHGAPVERARCAADLFIADPDADTPAERVYVDGAEPTDLSTTKTEIFLEAQQAAFATCGILL